MRDGKSLLQQSRELRIYARETVFASREAAARAAATVATSREILRRTEELVAAVSDRTISK